MVGILVVGGLLVGGSFLILRPAGDETAPSTALPAGVTLRKPAPDDAPGSSRPAEFEPSDRIKPRPAPPVTFDPPFLDFGLISPNDKPTGTITLQNTGGEPVKLVLVRPSCKCTTVEDLDGSIIAPGATLDVTASLDPLATSGTRTTRIQFVFEGYAPQIVEIRARAGRVVGAEPAQLGSSETPRGTITLTAADDRPFRVLAANGKPPVFVDFDPAVDAPRTSYRLGYDLARYDSSTCLDADGNRMPLVWVIETDHPDAPIVDLQVRHVPCSLPGRPENGRMWVLSRRYVVLGRFDPGASAEFDVFLKWMRGSAPLDTIRSVRSESDQFDAELVAVTRVGDVITCEVRVTPRPGVRGLVHGNLRFFGRVPGHSSPVLVIARVAGDAEPRAWR